MMGNVPLIVSLLTAAGAITGAIYLPMWVKHSDLKKLFSERTVDIMAGLLLAYGVIAVIAFVTDLVTWRSGASLNMWHW